MDEKDIAKCAFQAQLDQFAAGMEQVAALLWTHFGALRKAGFDGEQALRLTAELQGRLFRGPSQPWQQG